LTQVVKDGELDNTNTSRRDEVTINSLNYGCAVWYLVKRGEISGMVANCARTACVDQ
jgi:hypothetical protein